MSIFFEILVRIASYGPQIDQSHGENRVSYIISIVSQAFDRDTFVKSMSTKTQRRTRFINIQPYHMAESASRQDEANPAF